jgi:AcrR family transcriptional regulator
VTADTGKERLGRGEHARQRILRAALDVLADDGMPGFSMEAVARRAGASKPTLYRRWNSASALLVDAMDAQFRPLPDVDTGDLRADLITLLTGFAASLTDVRFPRLMAAFIDAAERAPALAEMHGRLTDRRREPLARLLVRAAQRGQITPSLDVELVVDQLAAPFFYRRFVAHRPIPGDMPGAVVDAVLAAYGSAPQ